MNSLRDLGCPSHRRMQRRRGVLSKGGSLGGKEVHDRQVAADAEIRG